MSASHVQIAELIEVSLDDINIPPGNHRQDLGDLNGLAESIRTIGLVQPITVRQRDAGGYELVAGQRRLAAARLAGLSTLPAVVRGYADVESRKAMAVENLNRKDLEPLEAAAAYQELLDLGIGNEEVAALAGTSAQQVSDHTSLLSLPRKVRRELAGGAIDYPTALLLTQLADTPERLTRALHNARDGWSLTSAVQHELHARELERKTEVEPSRAREARRSHHRASARQLLAAREGAAPGQRLGVHPTHAGEARQGGVPRGIHRGAHRRHRLRVHRRAAPCRSRAGHRSPRRCEGRACCQTQRASGAAAGARGTSCVAHAAPAEHRRRCRCEPPRTAHLGARYG